MFRKLMPGLALILAGILLFSVGSEFLGRYTNAKWARAEWPTTQGTVSSSSLLDTDSGYVSVTVDYSYQVGGVRYAVKDTWSTDDPGAAQSKYARGAAVTVYYNPANPQEGVVEPRHFEKEVAFYVPMFGTIVGMVLPVVGIVLIWREVRQHEAVRRHKGSHAPPTRVIPNRYEGSNLDQGCDQSQSIYGWLHPNVKPKLTEAEKQATREDIWRWLDEHEAWANRELRPIMQRVNEQCLDGKGEIDICANVTRKAESIDPTDYWIQCTLAWGRRWIRKGLVGGYMASVELGWGEMICVGPMDGDPVATESAKQPGWEFRVEQALTALVQNASACAWQSKA